MLGWVDDIEKATLENDTFRTVLFTGEHTQLTVMRLAPAEHVRSRYRVDATAHRSRGGYRCGRIGAAGATENAPLREEQ